MPEVDPFNLEKPARELARGAIRGALDGIRDWWYRGVREDSPSIAKPSRSVLILGPGGTGKSSFARLLAGDLDWLDDRPGKYAESIDIERFALLDDPDVEVVVAPGQHYRRGATWPELLQQVSGGEFRGIVLMNAFGYHSLSTPSFKAHELYAGSKPKFLEAYFKERRDDEIRVLRELIPHLSNCSKRVWVLSVVAKQDLWVNQQRQVMDHYVRGEYAGLLADVASKLGQHAFHHETVLLSLIIRNLVTTAGETLQKNAEGYDMHRLYESLETLLRVLAGLRTWEAEP